MAIKRNKKQTYNTITALRNETIQAVDGDAVYVKELKKTFNWVSGNSETDDSKYIINQTSESANGRWVSDEVLKGDLSLETIDSKVTGFISGGELTSLGAGIVRIAQGQGQILDNTDPENLVYTKVTFNQTDIDLSASDNVYYIYVDNNGDVLSTTTEPNHVEYRLSIWLHRVSIRSGLVTGVSSIVNPIHQINPTVYDLFKALGAIKSGLVLSPNGVNLSLNLSVGEVYLLGANYFNNPLEPNELTISSQTPLTFRMVTQNGTQGVDTTFLDVGNYDVSNVITPVTGGSNSATIFTVYAFPAVPNFRVLYGQTVYTTTSEAFIALENGEYNPVLPDTYNNAVLLGWIIAKKTATNLSDGTEIFITSNKFGMYGGSISTSGAGSLLAVNNLSDVQDITTAQNNLNVWSKSGNTGTNPATNFIGTTDGQDLVFRTNNVERARFSGGVSTNFGLGTTTPTYGIDNQVDWLGAQYGQMALGRSGQAGAISFRRGSDGQPLGQVGYATKTDAGAFIINSAGGAGSLSLQTGGNQRIFIGTTGLVIVGTGTATKTLDINGELRIRTLPTGLSTENILVANGSGDVRSIPTTSLNNLYNLDGTLSGNRIVTQGTNTLSFTSNAVNGFSVDGATFSVDSLNNRVGIGTTSPTDLLHVQGTARITGAIKDSSNSAGASGQGLSSTVTGTAWAWFVSALGTTGTDINLSNNILNIPTASASNRGALSSADWSIFNGKQTPLVSGTNIKTINSNSLLGSGDLVIETSTTVKVSLTSAQLIALNTTPITAIASPGAGKVIKIENFTFRHTFVTTAMNTGALIGFYYGTTNNIGSQPVDYGSSFLYDWGDTSFQQIYDNQAITLRDPSNTITSGDSTLDIYITYKTITL